MNAPDWLLGAVAPTRRAQPETRASSPKTCAESDGTPYGLKALDNACDALANAGPGQRDRAVGENVLAIGSLVAGGELDERHTLCALMQAGQRNPGGDANFVDKIERAFETGKQNPRNAPQQRHALTRRTKRHSKDAKASKSNTEGRPGDGSYPSRPSCPGVSDQPGAEKKTHSIYDQLVKRIGALGPAEEAGARAILAEALAGGLSDLQIEFLIRLIAKKVRIGIKPFKGLLAEIRKEATAADEPGPEERERLQREDDERRKREADEKLEALTRSCSQIASSQTLLDDMEAVVHRLGVVREGAAIRGAYLTTSSRLLRKRAISNLRRGAAAGGKNVLLTTVLRLIPPNSVVVMSSGSPMSLIYFGGGNKDALKHKVIYVQEAAILAEKNGVENPLTVMLRVLISEGCIDHLLAIPQASGPPVTMKIKRNGPVAVIITSARDNVESEMLTRLLTSDADESHEQTKAVVKGLLANDDRDEEEPDLTPWLDFQLWLELEAPYDVSVPFGAAIYRAYERRLGAFPNAIQLRVRRDVSGLISAIKTSAVLYKAQRDRDAKGRIFATIDDYRHAHEAFDEGISSLYGVKTRKEIAAVIKAVEELGGSLGESVKVTVAALRHKLGINSNSTASARLTEAVEQGALEVDEEKCGSGRGQPRYFRLLRTAKQIAAEPAQGVFPPPGDVLREINSPPSVGSGHEDKTDRTDRTNSAGKASVNNSVPPDEAEKPFRRDLKPEVAP